MSMKNIPLLDANNNIFGETTIAEAMQNNDWRRVVRVFLLDEQGRVLLQKRGAHMNAYPGCWDQSAGGHVDVGETDLQAAERELFEEVGVRVSLIEVMTGLRSTIPEDKAISSVYVATIAADTAFVIDHEEVSEVCWVSIEELEAMFAKTPKQFPPLFIEIWHHSRDKILAI